MSGDIHEAIYADDCYFADPTVSFSGLQKWQRNLQLLVPFFIEPHIALKSLQTVCTSPAHLKACPVEIPGSLWAGVFVAGYHNTFFSDPQAQACLEMIANFAFQTYVEV